jgi:hypothetical protein
MATCGGVDFVELEDGQEAQGQAGAVAELAVFVAILVEGVLEDLGEICPFVVDGFFDIGEAFGIVCARVDGGPGCVFGEDGRAAEAGGLGLGVLAREEAEAGEEVLEDAVGGGAEVGGADGGDGLVTGHRVHRLKPARRTAFYVRMWPVPVTTYL